MNRKKIFTLSITALLILAVSPIFAQGGAENVGAPRGPYRDDAPVQDSEDYTNDAAAGAPRGGVMNGKGGPGRTGARGNMNPAPSGGVYVLEDFPMQDIDDQELEGLLLMREEEKLARDVYQALGEMWNMPVFFNISQSEGTHMEAVKALLDRYDIQDPVGEDDPGEFTDPELQALYDDLTAQGSESLEAALSIGAAVEDLDIKDLSDLLEETDNQDITVVYENLLRGSENHIRSFTGLIESQGGSYEAQYISDEQLAAVLSR